MLNLGIWNYSRALKNEVITAGLRGHVAGAGGRWTRPPAAIAWSAEGRPHREPRVPDLA